MFTGNIRTASQVCKNWNGRNSGKEALTRIGNGYRKGMVLRKEYQAHRIVFALVHDYWPKEVDHINGIRTDNRPVNLREVDRQTNAKNQKLRRDNSSRHTGIYWREREKRWAATITHNGKIRYLGGFENIEGAISARQEAQKKFGFHPNHGRV